MRRLARNAPQAQRPTVTVAIPLHRSLPWIDTVVANVRSLPSMVTEILVSDRTCIDDAAEQLRRVLADDPRVSVTAEPAGFGWQQHYRDLLDRGTGDLFMWMPHDDVFDPSWVPVLAEALHSHPEAWLAWGRMERVLADGVTPYEWVAHFPPPGVQAGWDVLQLTLWGEGGVPFRGLFRRRQVVESGIRLEDADTFPMVDLLWVTAVGLRSALVYDDRTVTQKRYHPDSAHASWMYTTEDREDAVLDVLRQLGPRGRRGRRLRTLAEQRVRERRARDGGAIA